MYDIIFFLFYQWRSLVLLRFIIDMIVFVSHDFKMQFALSFIFTLPLCIFHLLAFFQSNIILTSVSHIEDWERREIPAFHLATYNSTKTKSSVNLIAKQIDSGHTGHQLDLTLNYSWDIMTSGVAFSVL